MGFLAVRTCSMPPGPYQSLSCIRPVNGSILASKNRFFFFWFQSNWHIPFESVVRSRPANNGRFRIKGSEMLGCQHSLGSWNMTRTPSRETWTSAEAVTGHRLHNYGTKYRSRSLRHHRGLQLRNWLVYFRDMLQKPVQEHVRRTGRWLRCDYGLHRGDPNILT